MININIYQISGEAELNNIHKITRDKAIKLITQIQNIEEKYSHFDESYYHVIKLLENNGLLNNGSAYSELEEIYKYIASLIESTHPGLIPKFLVENWRTDMKVIVQNNQIEKAIKDLKRKLTKEGFFSEIKERRFYDKPSVQRKKKQAKAAKRRRKRLRRF